MEEPNFSKYNPDYDDSEVIDIKDLFNFLVRNRLVIASFTIVFLLLSIIYSAFKKNTWEGRFQIVLDPKPANQIPFNLLDNVKIPGFSGFNMSKSGSLATEVAILESPFVLMPAFDFVMDKKNQIKKDLFNYNFSNWKKSSLLIELEKGTTVLNIAYRDKDKSIIKPVLTKISKIYQDYSGQTKKRKFVLANDYLQKQISLFKSKSFESIRSAQQYAIEQDLRILDLNNDRNQTRKIEENSELSSSVLSNIGIENVRVSAANKIRNIDIQIAQIQELNDVKQLQYIGSTIPGLVKEGLPQILETIETNLIELRSKYTDKDKSIIRLLEKRDLYIDLLKERSIGYLKADKMSTEALMLSAMRPKGVLLKYKELMREANRDENMLIELENQLKILNLEKARTEDPWKLITKPTLKEDPVAPNRISISLFGIVLGFAVGCLVSFIREKNSKI